MIITRKDIFIIAFLFIFSCSSALRKEKMIETAEPSIPKIPLYLGSSYHILYGNPKNQYGLDPGFYHPIFDFTYENQKTTEDGKFLIPDQSTSHKMSTCSFTSEIKSFSGTQSYQEDLKKIAQVTVGSEKYLDFAFSMSRSWERVQNTTTVQKNSLTHATAECQAYEIVLDKFTLPQLSKNFINGAIQCYQRSNWTDFIQQFGTHFIHQITMGGRATQQISYSFESVSKMESLNIDLNITAKASFAKFFADASFDWNKYSKSINYSEKMSTSKTQLYIGGQPPRTGNVYDWQAKIVDNPMPITYKMYPLTELLSKIEDIKYNKDKAIEQFTQALQLQCSRVHCRPTTPDFPKPPPAYIVTQKTPVYGNSNGNAFEQFVNSTTMQLRRIHVRSGKELDNLQLFISDGVQQQYTAAVGGTGGGPGIYEIPDGEYVNQIEYRTGDRIDSITFLTNKGNKSPTYGGTGGGYHLVTIPQDYRIVGFYGVQGGTVYKLGFIIAKTIYPATYGQAAGIELQRIMLE